MLLVWPASRQAMASRRHYTQDDEICQMLEKKSDHRCDSTEDESIFIYTLPKQYILQFSECIRGTNRKVAVDTWFS
jgi:hypothetical protein